MYVCVRVCTCLHMFDLFEAPVYLCGRAAHFYLLADKVVTFVEFIFSDKHLIGENEANAYEAPRDITEARIGGTNQNRAIR